MPSITIQLNGADPVDTARLANLIWSAMDAANLDGEIEVHDPNADPQAEWDKASQVQWTNAGQRTRRHT